jgi:hypothetical protein
LSAGPLRPHLLRAAVLSPSWPRGLRKQPKDACPTFASTSGEERHRRWVRRLKLSEYKGVACSEERTTNPWIPLDRLFLFVSTGVVTRCAASVPRSSASVRSSCCLTCLQMLSLSFLVIVDASQQ